MVVLPDPPLGFRTTIRCMFMTSGRAYPLMFESVSVRSETQCCKRRDASMVAVTL